MKQSQRHLFALVLGVLARGVTACFTFVKKATPSELLDEFCKLAPPETKSKRILYIYSVQLGIYSIHGNTSSGQGAFPPPDTSSSTKRTILTQKIF